jgi:hypothetical protein
MVRERRRGRRRPTSGSRPETRRGSADPRGSLPRPSVGLRRPTAGSRRDLAHRRCWNKPPPPRQRPTTQAKTHTPLLPPTHASRFSLSLSLSFSRQAILYSVGERLPVELVTGSRRNRSWWLGRSHAGSRGLLTHAGGSADLSSDFFFPFPSSLLPPVRMRERRSIGNQEGNRHTKCRRRKREHRRTRGYRQACPVISLSGVVRLGGEPWVDFSIFRGFGYYLVFWFYFMKVYLVRCQPFNRRYKTHVFCTDQTAGALFVVHQDTRLYDMAEAIKPLKSIEVL